MKSMMSKLVAFLREEEGLTMVEYAIAGALVAAGSVLAFSTLGINVGTQITKLGCYVTGSTNC